MTLRIFGLVLVIGLSVDGMIFAQTASACRCREPAASAAYKMADRVVLARVVAVESGNARAAVMRLAVKEAWKVPSVEQILVVTGEPCAYPVAVDEIHLLFLKVTPSGQLETARCYGNGPLSMRSAALAWLRRHAKQVPVTAGGPPRD